MVFFEIGVGVDTHTRKLSILRGRESRSKGDPIFVGGGWLVGWWLVGWLVGGRVERSGATLHPKNHYLPLVSCVLRLI